MGTVDTTSRFYVIVVKQHIAREILREPDRIYMGPVLERELKPDQGASKSKSNRDMRETIHVQVNDAPA